MGDGQLCGDEDNLASCKGLDAGNVVFKGSAAAEVELACEGGVSLCSY